jgi:hypothetical protein
MFDPIEVRHVWEEHLRGYSNNTATLWPILMFDSWISEASDQGAAAPASTSVANQLESRDDIAGR